MANDLSPSFTERYRTALLQHLSGATKDQVSSRLAHSLGNEACSSGIDARFLARTHDKAMAEIAKPTKPDEQANQTYTLSPGCLFFIEALGEIEDKKTEICDNRGEALKQNEQRLEEESERYQKLLIKAQRMQKRSQQLAHQILLAQEEERREISRELHDEVAQILAAINVQLAALSEIDAISFKRLEQGIQQTQEMIENSVNAVHRFAQKLRPTMLDDLGLIPALRSYIKDLAHPKDLDLSFTHVPEVEKMDNQRRTVFYRVAQEALLNVVRHAEAQSASVRLQNIPNGIQLEVQDDGKAFDVHQVFLSKDYNRLGLLGMKERVEMVSGKFFIESEPGKGTIVRADIPYSKNCEEKQIED